MVAIKIINKIIRKRKIETYIGLLSDLLQADVAQQLPVDQALQVLASMLSQKQAPEMPLSRNYLEK
jgi:hypothetical protein